MNKKIATGVVHKIPADLRQALLANKAALDIWEDLTPLARNEWICWTITVRTDETRKKHIGRVITELQEGKRQPCCWLGCIHRTDKSISPSVQHLISRKSKSK